jgi:flagellin
MIIQHNMQAANANRMLGTVVTSQAKSTEKLSSGYRINRAADDAAGLSISEKMRGQIRGLNQASTNAQDGISLIQTAEGALTETHSILQRMRELAVQAATDTNVDKDREAIQSEIDELTSEINRISKTTQYNKMELLDGSRSENAKVEGAKVEIVETIKGGKITPKSSTGITQTGTAGTELKNTTISVSGDAGSIFAGTIDLGTANKNTVKLEKTADGIKVELDSVVTSASGNKETFDIEDNITADEKGNYVYNNHGVSFTISKADYEAWDTGNTVTLNIEDAAGKTAGTGITHSITAGTPLEVGVDNDYDTTGGAKKYFSIGEITFSDDFKASKEDKDFKIELESILVGTAAEDKFTLKLTLGDKVIDNIEVSKSSLADTAGTYDYNNHGISFTVNWDAAGTATDTDKWSISYDLEDKLGIKTETIAAETKDQSLYFQVGANKNQSINVSIDDMGADALGLTSSTAGGDFTTTQTVTNGTDKNKTKYSLNMTTRETANNAIETIDNAIEMVSKQRSKLGAIQNRLEHTIANLDNTSENLQSAESNIRDVDMAEEMVVYSKNNILQQAAQSMLAQANQSTQGVLSLLQ